MIIRIKGNDLPDYIKDMGVKPGEKYDATPVPESRTDAMRFRVNVDGNWEYCTVMRKNYDVV